jgi:hypothetical protein
LQNAPYAKHIEPNEESDAKAIGDNSLTWMAIMIDLIFLSKYEWLNPWIEWLYQQAEQRQPLGFITAIVATSLVFGSFVAIAIYWFRIQSRQLVITWRNFGELHCNAALLILLFGYLAIQLWKRLFAI